MIKSIAEHRQILVDFLAGNLGILLCRGYVRMPQYSADTRYARIPPVIEIIPLGVSFHHTLRHT